MATTTSSASPYTPTGAGFQNPHFPNHNGPHDAHVVIYGYTPSLALCILGMILYAISTVAHLFQVIRYRVWNFAPLTLACLLETTGYIFRTLSSQNDPYSIIWFVVQYFLIVVAPVFISASIYFSINRLIAWAASTTAFNDVSDNKQRRWWLSPKLILWGFIIADVLTTSMQIAGAALVGSSESNYRNQTRTTSFTIFLLVLLLFRISLGRDLGARDDVRSKEVFMLAVAGASLLVYLRTVFRLAETAEGLFGYVSTHEKFFGTLEFAPVVLAVWILAVWHPGRWLERGLPALSSPSLQDEEYTSKDEEYTSKE